MLHYSQFIRLYGPLRQIYCMHFERKHQYFKRLQRTTLNYINVTHTLSNRHQLNFSRNYDKPVFNESQYNESLIKKTSPITIPLTLLNKLHLYFNCIFDNIDISKSIFVKGLEYKIEQHTAYILEFDIDCEIPIFFKTQYIVFVNNNWYLCGNIFISRVFCEHIHAYELCFSEEWIICKPDNILSTHKHKLYINNNTWYAVPLFKYP